MKERNENLPENYPQKSKLWQDRVWTTYIEISTAANFLQTDIYTYTHTHIPFNGPFSRTTRVNRYQKGKTDLDFTEARDSKWQWHQLGHMQVCTLLQTDNHASTPPLSFLQAGCSSCRPTNSVRALKASFSRSTLLKCFLHSSW